MAKNNYYVVFIGRKVGIYETWDECKLHTNGFPGSKFKGYISDWAAKKALKDFENGVSTKKTILASKTLYKPIINYNTISVDGACSGNPGKGEYQCVDTKTEEVVFSSNLFLHTTNNLMEFFALVEGLIWLNTNKSDKLIYSDSKTAIAWVRNKKVNTTLKQTKDNKDSFFLIDKYEQILDGMIVDMNTILKWDTKKLGEIKADFGRK